MGHSWAVFRKTPIFYRTITLFSDQSRVYSYDHPFYKLGLSSPMAVLFTSLISYFFFRNIIILYSETPVSKKYWLAILLTIAAMLLPPMTYMSRVSTPDMFIFQFMLIFMIGLLKKWNKWAMFVLLFGITFIQDYITFTLTYIMAVFLFPLFPKRKLIFLYCTGIVLLAMYLAIIKFYHYPGWKDLFYDTFIDRRPIISTHPIDVSLKDYLSIIYIKIIYFKSNFIVGYYDRSDLLAFQRLTG